MEQDSWRHLLWLHCKDYTWQHAGVSCLQCWSWTGTPYNWSWGCPLGVRGHMEVAAHLLQCEAQSPQSQGEGALIRRENHFHFHTSKRYRLYRHRLKIGDNTWPENDRSLPERAMRGNSGASHITSALMQSDSLMVENQNCKHEKATISWWSLVRSPEFSRAHTNLQMITIVKTLRKSTIQNGNYLYQGTNFTWAAQNKIQSTFITCSYLDFVGTSKWVFFLLFSFLSMSFQHSLCYFYDWPILQLVKTISCIMKE